MFSEINKRPAVVALVLATVFTLTMFVVDWEALQGEGTGFRDRAEYYEYFRYESNVLEYVQVERFLDYFTNELLWHYSVAQLHRRLGLPLEWIFGGISIICLWSYSYFLTSRTHFLYLIFLVNPLIVTLAFSQLRSALAFSMLFLAGIFLRKIWAIIAAGVSMLIHTSMVIFLGIGWMAYFSSRYLQAGIWSRNMTLLVLLTVGVIVSIAIGPVREVILNFLGDRRAEYVEAGSSLAYSSYWLCLWAVMFLQSQAFFSNPINSYAFVVLSVVAANVVTGGYSLRFLALCLPVIIYAISQLSVEYRRPMAALFVVYGVIQWKYWLRLSFI